MVSLLMLSTTNQYKNEMNKSTSDETRQCIYENVNANATASHTGKETYIINDNQRKPFLVLKQIYTSQPFSLYLGNGW